MEETNQINDNNFKNSIKYQENDNIPNCNNTNNTMNIDYKEEINLNNKCDEFDKEKDINSDDEFTLNIFSELKKFNTKSDNLDDFQVSVLTTINPKSQLLQLFFDLDKKLIDFDDTINCVEFINGKISNENIKNIVLNSNLNNINLEALKNLSELYNSISITEKYMIIIFNYEIQEDNCEIKFCNKLQNKITEIFYNIKKYDLIDYNKKKKIYVHLDYFGKYCYKDSLKNIDYSNFYENIKLQLP